MKKVIMKRVVVLLFLVLLVPNGNLFLQEIPDCCCFPFTFPQSGEKINQDSSLVIDTCGIWLPSLNCDSAYWNNILHPLYGEEAKMKVWAKNYWSIHFKVDAIPIDSTKGDTLLYVTYADFDSINYSKILEGFRQIESKYGSFRLRKAIPQASSGYRGRYFVLYFDNYVKLGDIALDLYNLNEYLSYSFGNWPKVNGEIEVEDLYDNDRDLIQISPNPANEYIKINFERCPTSVRCRTSEIIEIYNVLGERVKSPIPNTLNPNPQFRVDISDLPDGVYFVRIDNFFKSFVKF